MVVQEKYTKPLKLKDIPTNNHVAVIDNYSFGYDYIVEGDKLYLSTKGKDEWHDVSDNDLLRKGLHNFLRTRYNYKGYQDNEREIGKKILAGTYNYYRDRQNRSLYSKSLALRPLSAFAQFYPTATPQSKVQLPAKSTRLPVPKKTAAKLSVAKKTTTSKPAALPKQKSFWEKANESAQKVINLLRAVAKAVYTKVKSDLSSLITKGSIDTKAKLQIKPELQKFTKANSQYALIPGSYTGDTINTENKNRYYIPESIDLNNTRLGIRNRGEYSPISSEGAIVTSSTPSVPYNLIDKNNKSQLYIGIDKSGRFKVGNIDAFGWGDMLTATTAQDMSSFPINNYGNASLYDLNNGGRVILRAGNETRLVSGSAKNMLTQFDDMKRRHNVPAVTVYSLDNSYNTGFRTRNRQFSSSDLHSYDEGNATGGNFMYIDNRSWYPEKFLQTPNIRTKESESYLKGHSLVNRREGVVLHHTADMLNDISGTVKHLRTSDGNSAHVVIGFNGQRAVLARPDLVTFHAGLSRWNNQNNVNDFMIGIEFLGNTNLKDLTPDLINSAIEYLAPILRDNNITLENITTHESVRNLYNDYAKRTGEPLATGKPDINYDNYVKMINALKQRLYYKK